MSSLLAFPIPIDAQMGAWAIPVFGAMALTTVALIIWQAVRYFRNHRDDDDSGGS